MRLRHGSSHSHSLYGSGVGLPNMDPDRIPDDLMSLEDFLAESQKTPNRVCFVTEHYVQDYEILFSNL